MLNPRWEVAMEAQAESALKGSAGLGICDGCASGRLFVAPRRRTTLAEGGEIITLNL
jgi:hypothetical protein